MFFFCLSNWATEYWVYFLSIFSSKKLASCLPSGSCHTLPNTSTKTVHFFVTKKQFFASNNFSISNRKIFLFRKNKINEWTALWYSVVIRSTDRKRMFSDRAQHKSINRPTLDRGVYAAESERANCLLIRAYQIPKGKKAADGPTERMHITQYWLLRLNNLRRCWNRNGF